MLSMLVPFTSHVEMRVLSCVCVVIFCNYFNGKAKSNQRKIHYNPITEREKKE